jgi:hypothetical protein
MSNRNKIFRQGLSESLIRGIPLLPKSQSRRVVNSLNRRVRDRKNIPICQFMQFFRTPAVGSVGKPNHFDEDLLYITVKYFLIL